ncbi:MAG: STAS domain-containing protein [Chloroflexota bacterium]|nr:STAS domain-containing protein [Chloroflexota bacterium]
MPSANVKASVRKPSGDIRVIDIDGEITAFAEDELTDAYNEASRGNPKVIIWNFTDLEYMNSSGIGLLVTLLIRANRHGQKMLAYGLDEHYKHIFELTRLDEAIQICSSEAQAMATAA